MKVVCGWCGITIREGAADGPISHGICPACAKKLREDVYEDVPEDVPEDTREDIPEDTEPDLVNEFR